MRASAPLLLPGRPRAAHAVPSALTPCRRTVRGSALPGRPRPVHASRRGLLARRHASALRIALSAAEALRPPLSCPFCQHALKLQSRPVPGRGRQSAALNRMSLPGEPAGRGRKAGRHRMCHPRRSVRQRNEVKEPRSGARSASPCPAPDCVITCRLTDQHYACRARFFMAFQGPLRT
ncbi:hypothetical protein BW31_01089 [Pantoea agglomerans]|nr:hypothetical protein BW31_01089 [Pantoea agglomerans]